jgi:hypothetical protein
MPTLASLVPKLRPMLIATSLLAVSVFALRDGQHRHCRQRHAALVLLEGRAPQVLDWSAPSIDPWDRPAHVPWLISPSAHPDARPWPQGMVMGMDAPAIDSAIVLWEHSPLDTMLSAFIEALRALES